MTSCSPAERTGPPSDPGRGLVRGRLQVEFALSGERRSFIARQYASYPFHICRVQYHDLDMPSLATLYLQSCAGGLYEDDVLDISLTTAPRAEAHVTTQASTIVHSMPAGQAVQDARIEAQESSYLEYLPDPQILFPASRFSSKVTVALAAGAKVLIGDAFLMYDPAGGTGMFSSYSSEIHIEDDAGRRLALDRLKLDMGSVGLRRAGVMGCFGAQGTLLVATLDPNLGPILAGLRAIDLRSPEAVMGVSALPKSAGLIVRILACDGVALRRAMQACWSACRYAIKASYPAPRRK